MIQFSIEEVHKAFSEKDDAWFEERKIQKPFGKNKHMSYHRIRNFIHNGIVCKMCGIKGLFYSFHDKHHKFLDKIPITQHPLTLVAEDGRYLTLDHIIPVSFGGGYKSLDNHQTLCNKCNHEIKSIEDQKLAEARREGIILPLNHKSKNKEIK